MTKKEFIKKLHKKLKQEKLSDTIGSTSKIYDSVFETLSDEITQGKAVNLPEFGNFYSKFSERHNFGNKIKRWTIYFKPSQILKKRIND